MSNDAGNDRLLPQHTVPVAASAAQCTQRHPGLGLLRLPLATLTSSNEASLSEPSELTFDEKRHLFEELLTPCDGSEAPLHGVRSLTPTSAGGEALSSRSFPSARSAKTQEFLLSPRAVPQEDGDATHRSQPFAEASPRHQDAAVRRSSSSASVFEAVEIVATTASGDRELMKALIETQTQLAQVQQQLATVMQASVSTASRPTVTPARCLSASNSYRRRRWGSQAACSAIAGADGAVDVAQRVLHPIEMPFSTPRPRACTNHQSTVVRPSAGTTTHLRKQTSTAQSTVVTSTLQHANGTRSRRRHRQRGLGMLKKASTIRKKFLAMQSCECEDPARLFATGAAMFVAVIGVGIVLSF